MAQGPPELPESIVLQAFSGLKNTVAPERLTGSDLERATNIDLDDAGQPRRRRGFDLKIAGAFHSIRDIGGKVYGVKDGMLGIIRPDYSFFDLTAVGPQPVCYTPVNEEVFFSCASTAGVVGPEEFVSPWGATDGQGRWWSPVINPTDNVGAISGKLLGDPLRATCIEAYSGRIYLTVGKTLWATELYQYHYVDRTKNYMQFEHDIVLLMSVNDGIFVGTTGGLYFIKGVLGKFQLDMVSPAAVLAGSGVRAPADLIHPQAKNAPMPTGDAVMLMSNDGILAGFDGGTCYNLTQGQMLFPQAVGAAALFRQDAGMNHYLAAIDSAGDPGAKARIGDYVEAEIVRAADIIYSPLTQILTQIGIGDTLSVELIVGNPYTAYALALDFDDPQYWVSGTQYNPITTLPGYTFTRSGSQGAVDASGAVQYFAANVPAINSAGYHAYGALTNSILRSQEFDNASWPKSNITVAANNVVAPDGTTTADTLTATATGLCYVGGTLTGTIGTISVFTPAGGTAPFAFLQVGTGVGTWFCTLNRSTGAVSAMQFLGGTNTFTSYPSVSDGNGGWRFAVSSTSNITEVYMGPADTSTSRNAVNGQTVPLWQAQGIEGVHPDGGPIIVTAGATASIGDSVLYVSETPAEEDFLIWVVADLGTPVQDNHRRLMALTRADYSSHLQLERVGNAGNITFETRKDNGGHVSLTLATANAAGRASVGIRRKAGKTAIVAAFNGVTGVSLEVTEALITSLARLHIGGGSQGLIPTNGRIRGAFKRVATYSDAEAQALMLAEIA